MYYYEGSVENFKAKTIKELKNQIEKSNCYNGAIYRGNQIYAFAKKMRKYSTACGTFNAWDYERCI